MPLLRIPCVTASLRAFMSVVLQAETVIRAPWPAKITPYGVTTNLLSPVTREASPPACGLQSPACRGFSCDSSPVVTFSFRRPRA